MFKYILISFAVVFPLWSDLSYQIQDLGTLNHFSSFASDINNSGEIVGTIIIDQSKEPQPFYWKQGTDIKTLENTNAGFLSINEAGIIAGCFKSGWFSWSPFIWNPLTSDFTDLGPSFHTSIFPETSTPLSFKDYMLILSSSYDLYLWQGHAVKISNLFEDDTGYFDMNNHQQLLGMKVLEEDNFFPVILTITDQSKHEVVELKNHLALRMNDHNQIVGTTFSEKDGFFWDSKTGIQIIPSFDPIALNNNGVVIGVLKSEGDKEIPAVWESGTLRPLSELIVKLPENETWQSIDEISAINDQGDIVGVGITKTNQKHAILLRKL